MSQTPLLSVHELLIGYPGLALLPPVTFSLVPGQVTSIVGHNGSGKSTLLKTLLKLQPKLAGGLVFAPEARFGYVPQRESMDPIYPVRVRELVETGRYGLRRVGRVLGSEDHARIDESMRATGIESLEDRLFRTLSGGEQQRALLARALCAEPTLLVLDEPTASMDERNAYIAMELTLELAKKRGAAVLMVNHFIDLVRKISDQVVVLDRDHQAVAVGKPEEVLKDRGRIHG